MSSRTVTSARSLFGPGWMATAFGGASVPMIFGDKSFAVGTTLNAPALLLPGAVVCSTMACWASPAGNTALTGALSATVRWVR